MQTTQDIIWDNDPPLCTVIHRARGAAYSCEHSSLNQERQPFVLRVPVPLLLLESQWPCFTSPRGYTIYGSPRLLTGAQVCFGTLLDASPSYCTTQPVTTWVNSMSILRSGHAWYCPRRRVSILVLGFVAHSSQFHVRNINYLIAYQITIPIMQVYLSLFWNRSMTLPISDHDAVRLPIGNCFHLLSTHFSYNLPATPPDVYDPFAYPDMTARINSYLNAFRQMSTMRFKAMNVLSIYSVSDFFASNPHPTGLDQLPNADRHIFDYTFQALDDMDSFFDNY